MMAFLLFEYISFVFVILSFYYFYDYNWSNVGHRKKMFILLMKNQCLRFLAFYYCFRMYVCCRFGFKQCFFYSIIIQRNLIRRMSITISNWKQICDAPTNKSPSKMVYSFPRANRFNPQKQNKSTIFYNNNSKLSKRATSFGYGNKYDFTKDLPNSPPPNSYNAHSEFQAKKDSKEKGFCFGDGRTEMMVTGPLAETINNKNPGPGAYEPMKKMKKIAYSLRGKFLFPQPEAEKVPGPGTYEQNNFFNKEGSVFVSKHQNHKAIKFDSGGQRFKRPISPNPGPGKYNTSTVQFSSNGKYSLSNLQNSKVRTFGHSIRKTFANRCQTPGPGNYTLPSEFGYYVNKTQFLRPSSGLKHVKTQQN